MERRIEEVLKGAVFFTDATIPPPSARWSWDIMGGLLFHEMNNPAIKGYHHFRKQPFMGHSWVLIIGETYCTCKVVADPSIACFLGLGMIGHGQSWWTDRLLDIWGSIFPSFFEVAKEKGRALFNDYSEDSPQKSGPKSGPKSQLIFRLSSGYD